MPPLIKMLFVTALGLLLGSALATGAFAQLDARSDYLLSTGLLALLLLSLILVAWLLLTRRAVKQQTLALQSERARFKSLFDDSRQAITLLDDGHYVAANKASLAMLGMQQLDQFIGLTPADISPTYQPDGRRSTEKAAELIAITLANGSHQFEWEHIRANGEHFTASVSLTALHEGDKVLLHVVWSDITAQKKAEQELAEYREHLERQVAKRTAELETLAESLRDTNVTQQAIFDAASSGILLVQNRRIVRCNRMIEQLFGYGHGEMLGQTTRSWYPDDATFQEIGATIQRALAEHNYYREDRYLVRKDGSRFWGRMSARLIDPTDPSKGLAGMIEDISAEHEAVASLRQASLEQQAIFDTATSGIALTKDRVLVTCNRRLHELCGWPEGEMVGKTTAIWYADETTNIAGGEPVYAAIWRGEAHTREEELIRRDGSRFWARLSGRAVDVHDRSRGTVWVIDDITTERRAKAEMQQAKALAEEAAKAKADFLANMSHEIRTPMNAVIGMTHLVLKTELTPRQREYLRKIQSSSQLLLGILNDILDFSKIEAEKMVVEHIDFELERVLDNVVTQIAERAAGKGLELIVDVDDDVPHNLLGDPLRIGQVLINYANNAVKFTEHGEVAIHVSLAQSQAGEVVLRFSVRDTGIGLSEEQSRQLFQSFQQADTSTTRKYGGTGLGLAICKRLAKLMGGEVGVNSQAGVGSDFWFTARLGRGQDREHRFLPRPDLRGRRILLVDDNDYAREVIGDMLLSMTFAVGSVASGSAALSELQRATEAGTPYDIVFLDWQMPEMDGLMTAAAIHKLGLRKQPHLIIITAYGRDELVGEAAKVGIEDILIKPVTISQLFETVMRTLGADLPQTPATHSNNLPDIGALAGAHALLVEDNDLNQEVATEFLHELGLEVDLAADGAAALAKVQAHAYDVVLMDMQMPVMDGLTATREIRKLPSQRDLPIIAMTANAMAGDRERCIDAGMNDHIPKPIDPAVLATTLLRWTKPAGKPLLLHTPEPSTHPLNAHQLDGISGLDVNRGLQLVRGRDTLYLSLMEKFVSGQADTPAQISSALASEDWGTAERLAHTLKGVAAQIGATQIQRTAEEMQVAIRQRQPQAILEKLLQQLNSDLPPLLSSIAARLPSPKVQERGPQLSPEACATLLQQLQAQLHSGDFASQQTLDEDGGSLRAALGEAYDGIAQAIRDYDFTLALQRLEKASAQREKPI